MDVDTAKIRSIATTLLQTLTSPAIKKAIEGMSGSEAKVHILSGMTLALIAMAKQMGVSKEGLIEAIEKGDERLSAPLPDSKKVLH